MSDDKSDEYYVVMRNDKGIGLYLFNILLCRLEVIGVLPMPKISCICQYDRDKLAILTQQNQLNIIDIKTAELVS
jgi:hypothetical protein